MLLLFDIDGTLLLRATDAHRDALHAALRRVHGIEIPEARVETAGRTDGAIARMILQLAGVPAERIDARMDRVRETAAREYARRVPDDLTATVAPGIPEALATLAAREDHVLALLTGNFEPIARLKLRAAGIGGFFASGQGAFGSDHEDRTELPAIARARAGGHPPERTVVIGDTPRDVACAQAGGVRCIGITTGPYGAADLQGADAVVAGAHELVPALDALRVAS